MIACDFCGYELRVSAAGGWGDGVYSCVCTNCYDPAPDSGEKARVQGFGATGLAAFESWQTQAKGILDALEEPLPVSVTDLFGDLERQVAKESARQLLLPTGAITGI